MTSGEAAGLLWDKGQHHIMKGRFDQARLCFMEVSRLRSADPAVWIQLAQVQQRSGHYRESHASALTAAALAPSLPGHVVPLARLLQNFEDRQRLQRLSDTCGWQAWAHAPDLFALARHVATIGLHDRALPILDRVDAIDPTNAGARYLRGVIEMFDGRLDRSSRAFARALDISPSMPQAHWMLSVSRKYDPEVCAVEKLKALIANSQHDPAGAAYLGYALHNHLHGLRRYDEAWTALEKAWAAKQVLTRYDAAKQEGLFSLIRETCDSGFIMGSSSTLGPPDGTRPIFIVGLHRSGTSLLERMLGGHPSIREGGESYAFSICLKLEANHACRQLIDEPLLTRSSDISYERVGRRFRDLMQWRAAGAAFVTEKLPGNFMLAGHILRALPGAVVLHMRRAALDTCASNLRTYFDEAAPYATGQQEMAHYHGQYERLMAHWHAAAPGRILDVDYARLVSDPEGTMRKVLALCGLDYDPRVIRVDRLGGSVRTASVMDVRQGIDQNRGEAWKPYRRQLEPLVQALEAEGKSAPSTSCLRVEPAVESDRDPLV